MIGTKLIPLTQGKFAIVDANDFDSLSKTKWFTLSSKNNVFYAVTGKRCKVMHRIIMNAPDGIFIDHINHDGLDNRKINLRFCTRSQNTMNQRKPRNTSSRFKGVSFHKTTGKWRASIKVGEKSKWLGLFGNEEGAAIAYNEAAIKYFGEFALLNIISKETV